MTLPILRRTVAALLLALCLAACGKSDRRTIAVIPKGTNHLFWQSIHAGAVKAGRELGVAIEWNGPPSETDYSRQIQILESMLARHVDGIAIAASDRNALDASLDRAAAMHIPVAIFDSGIDSDRYTTFVATNNDEAGRLAARKLGQLLGGKGSILVIQHVPGSRSTMDRERGFDEALAMEFPAITVAGRQFGMSDRSKAMATTENLLNANPGVTGIFASAEPSSTGAAQALKARGLAGKVKLVAFDTADNLVDDLKAGVIDALVAQDPVGIGYRSVAALVDMLNGKTPPKHIDLDAVVVTRDDLARPEIRALVFPDLKQYLQ